MKVLFLILLSISAKSQIAATIHSKIIRTIPVTVNLNGARSINAKTYHWKQISGVSVVLLKPDSAKCLASNVYPGVYKFELTVIGSSGEIKKDTATIRVIDQIIKANK